MTQKPLLSIGMIFRNDIRCIEKCLKALQPLREAIPCELVMADTGAVDGSRAVAEQYADVLIDFPWINDFSAARNAVMDRCSGIWYLTVDTDEYLDEDFSQLTKFLKKKNNPYNFGFVIQRNYNHLQMTPGDCEDFLAPRLVRMDTGARYQGLVHEAFIFAGEHKKTDLGSVVLHHDGYAVDSKGDSNRKKKRNLALLEKELERAPQDIRCITQCLESSCQGDQVRKYAALMIELLDTPKSEWSKDYYIYGPAAIRVAVIHAYVFGLPEVDRWIEYAREWFPDSIFTRIDVAYCAAFCRNARNESEQCLAETAIYWRGVEALNKGNYDRTELRVASVVSAVPSKQDGIRILELRSYCALKRWEEAQKRLEQLRVSVFDTPSAVALYLDCMLQVWKKSGLDVRPLFARAVDDLMECTDESNVQFLSVCRKELDLEPDLRENSVRELIAVLGDKHDIGRSALLQIVSDKVRVEQLLKDVNDWEAVPARSLLAAVRLDATFPEHFYGMPVEIMGKQAGDLMYIAGSDRTVVLTKWHNALKGGRAPGQVMWLFHLAAAAVQMTNWETETTGTLCDLYRVCTANYLSTFYTPQLCQEEQLNLHPLVVRFGWYLDAAENAFSAGDRTGYVKWLRKGLLVAPAMKHMVEFLIADMGRRKTPVVATPELLALAEQVRAILSQYAPDDPAVLAIKQSDAYKTVAALIETPAGIRGVAQ